MLQKNANKVFKVRQPTFLSLMKTFNFMKQRHSMIIVTLLQSVLKELLIILLSLKHDYWQNTKNRFFFLYINSPETFSFLI